MGAERYEVVVVNAKTGHRMTREWQAADLLKAVPWLKRMNARGNDIYVRPLAGPELILVDTLSAAGLQEMRRQGLSHAVAIESAPGQFQAWVKLSDEPLPKHLRKLAVSGLARVLPRIGSLGRLAGFTNQRVEPGLEQRNPYVLAREATGKIAPAAHSYLAELERQIQKIIQERRRSITSERPGETGTRRGPSLMHRDRGRSR